MGSDRVENLRSIEIEGAIMVQKLLFIVVVIFFMQGCAPIYVEPSGGARAKIRFVSRISGAANVIVFSYDKEDCKTGKAAVAALTGIALVHHRKKLGMPLEDEFNEKDYTEIYINANRPYVFDMSWSFGSVYTGTTSCRVTTVFDPKENQMYEASFQMDSEICQVSVNKIVDSGNGNYTRVPESSARRSAIQCH